MPIITDVGTATGTCRAMTARFNLPGENCGDPMNLGIHTSSCAEGLICLPRWSLQATDLTEAACYGLCDPMAPPAPFFPARCQPFAAPADRFGFRVP
jgi:hypothetical protein